MLVLIETDSTIPDKYKGHIKNQLLVIINGWSKNIQTETPAPTNNNETATDNGILGFISGFVKVFFIIIGVIIGIWIIAFIFYRLTRKGDTIGFQDFLIDSVFHSKTPAPPVSNDIVKANTVVEWAPPLPKEDPLSSYTPVNEKIVTPEIKIAEPSIVVPSPIIPSTEPTPTSGWIDPLNQATVATVEEPINTPIAEPVESIPDWLKVPMSQMEESTTVSTPETIPAETPVETPTETPVETTQFDADNTNVVLSESEDIAPPSLPEEVKNEDNNIPDWLKNVSAQNDDETKKDSEVVPSLVENTEDRLPDWLINSLQPDSESTATKATESLIVEEPKGTENQPKSLLDLKDEEEPKVEKSEKKSPKKPKATTQSKAKESTSSSSNDNIPDWLK